MTSLLDQKLTETKTNQALLNLKNYGVCSEQSTMALMELGYVSGSSKYFKPIPWAISFYDLTELGEQQAQAAADTIKPVDQDPFQLSKIDDAYYGELIFTAERIVAEIAKGHHIQVGRAAGDVMPAYLRHELHPEYFPTEPTND